MFSGGNDIGLQILGGGEIGPAEQRDADDGVRLAVENHGPAEHAGIGGELGHPERVADDRHVVLAHLVLAGSEQAPYPGTRLEHVEEMHPHLLAGDLPQGLHQWKRFPTAAPRCIQRPCSTFPNRDS